MVNWSRKLAGKQLVGRWTHHIYQLIRYLGEGATGTVYIAKELPNGRLLALKMSESFYTISSEVNVLRKLNQTSPAYRGPKFYDVDDGIISSVNQKVHFYTMEYISGSSYRKFIETHSPDWAVIFLLQMLKQLDLLHRSGWVFGDLKVDNILITKEKGKPEVRWFDVGGFTSFGRAIKEYTEFYDQAYWGVGSRKASVQYDLFACGMIFVEAFYPKRFHKTRENGSQILCEKIYAPVKLRWFLPIMEAVWQGKFQTAAQMHEAVRKDFTLEWKKGKNLQSVPISCAQYRQKRKKRSFVHRLMKTSVVLLSIVGTYILYLIYQAP